MPNGQPVDNGVNRRSCLLRILLAAHDHHAAAIARRLVRLHGLMVPQHILQRAAKAATGDQHALDLVARQQELRQFNGLKRGVFFAVQGERRSVQMQMGSQPAGDHITDATGDTFGVRRREQAVLHDILQCLKILFAQRNALAAQTLFKLPANLVTRLITQAAVIHPACDNHGQITARAIQGITRVEKSAFRHRQKKQMRKQMRADHIWRQPEAFTVKFKRLDPGPLRDLFDTARGQQILLALYAQPARSGQWALMLPALAEGAIET